MNRALFALCFLSLSLAGWARPLTSTRQEASRISLIHELIRRIRPGIYLGHTPQLQACTVHITVYENFPVHSKRYDPRTGLDADPSEPLSLFRGTYMTAYDPGLSYNRISLDAEQPRSSGIDRASVALSSLMTEDAGMGRRNRILDGAFDLDGREGPKRRFWFGVTETSRESGMLWTRRRVRGAVDETGTPAWIEVAFKSSPELLAREPAMASRQALIRCLGLRRNADR